MSTLAQAPDRLFRLAVSPLSQLRVSDATVSGDGSWIVEGYAATFDDTYTLYDGKWFRVRERIARHAFDNVLARVAAGDELVHLNHGHDMTSAVAATDVDGVGGLKLRADERGLKFEARVDTQDPDAIRMAVKMRRRVVAQASFAFTIAEEYAEIRDLDDGREDELWTIEEIASLYDVCVAAQGANPYTESTLRSLAAASLRVPDLGTLGRSGEAPEGQDVATPKGSGGTPVVAPGGPGGEEHRASAAAKRRVDATYRNLTRRIP